MSSPKHINLRKTIDNQYATMFLFFKRSAEILTSSLGKTFLLFFAFFSAAFSMHAQTVTIADVSGAENSGTITVTLSLDVSAGGAFDLTLSSANGTALAGSDYTAVSETVSFVGTGPELQTVDITISPDAVVEANETLTVSMSGLTGVGSATITDTATVTINNDDTATLTIADVSGNENDGAITVTVSLDNAVDGGFDVDVSSANGTATVADSDYTAVTNQTLTFAGTALENETFTITPTGDTKVEGNETVTISMSSLIPTTVAGGSITITDTATVTMMILPR